MEQNTADKAAEKAEIRRAILAQLDELPDKEQKLLVMRYYLEKLEERTGDVPDRGVFYARN
jgi:DNA-directed RNA polymerase specialized sigma subunit